DWTYVKDNVSGIFCIIDSGTKNEIYNIASENHMTNLEVIDQVIDWSSKTREESIQFVENRWGQDLRYSIDSSKLRELGWEPKYPTGIHKWF
ncbi:MAG: GDP-mannose 4,6-dehydratase, partial [Promethearchaeota archaeon]